MQEQRCNSADLVQKVQSYFSLPAQHQHPIRFSPPSPGLLGSQARRPLSAGCNHKEAKVETADDDPNDQKLGTGK